MLSIMRRGIQVFQKSLNKAVLLIFIGGSGLSLIVSACVPKNSTNSAIELLSNQSSGFSEKQSSVSLKQTVIRIGYIKTSLSAMVKERGTLERELGQKNIQIKWVGVKRSFIRTGNYIQR